MSDDDWENGYAKAVGVLLDGEAIPTPDRFGGRVVDDTFFVMLNASEIDLPWTLPSKLRPAARHGDPWIVQLDTSLTQRRRLGGARRRHRHRCCSGRSSCCDRRAVGAAVTDRPRTFDVCVVGSSNLDLVVTAPRHPLPGETLLGTAYHEYPGGKGLNQVVAATRAGAACGVRVGARRRRRRRPAGRRRSTARASTPALCSGSPARRPVER